MSGCNERKKSMRVIAYDFDGTIYDGDSSIDFYKFCIKKKRVYVNIG